MKKELIMDPLNRGLGTFWASGRLSSLEKSCLSSFTQRGYDVTIFSYENIENLPDDVKTISAEEIMPQSMVSRVRHYGKADLAHFSDFFRVQMISSCGLVWIDADMLMIGPAPDLPYENVIVREEQGGLNGAVLYIADQALQNALSSRLEMYLDRDLKWGETGPLLLQKVIRDEDISVNLYDSKYFFPIEHYDIWKVLLPEFREECSDKCQSAATIHLFNNILKKIGYWKDMAPPVGSFLYQALERDDLCHHFTDTYPIDIMRNVVNNFRLSQNGQALSLKAVLQQIYPSYVRTYRRLRGLPH